MRRAARALGAVVVLVVVVAGCGRSEGEEFREDSLRPVQQQLDRQRSRVAATLRVVRLGNARDARALREDVDALGARVRELRGLVPPDEARKEFDGYVGALRELLARLRAFPVALRRGDQAALDAASLRVQEATGAVQQRGEELEERLLAV